MDCTSLSEYLGSFAITLKVLQKRYAITRAMYELAEDAKKDGVRYIEVRFSPLLIFFAAQSVLPRIWSHA